MSGLILSRRRFLFAAPAIVAVTSIMPISTRALKVSWNMDVVVVHGVDERGNICSAVVPAQEFENQPNGSITLGRFKHITSIEVL